MFVGYLVSSLVSSLTAGHWPALDEVSLFGLLHRSGSLDFASNLSVPQHYFSVCNFRIAMTGRLVLYDCFF